jgi:hypothetical protein
MAGEFDGNYDRTKPWRNNITDMQGRPKSSYNGPWSSNEERLTQQALMVATMRGTTLQEEVRPNLPQIQLFPPRFGWGDRPQIGIDDVVSIDRIYVEPRVSWFSGGPGGYSGSTRNGLEGV